MRRFTKDISWVFFHFCFCFRSLLLWVSGDLEIVMSSDVVDVAARIMIMTIVISLMLLFLGIGVLVLIHVCIVGRAFRFGRRSENSGSVVDRGSPGSRGSMSMDDLEKLPCFHFQAREKGGSPVDCAVCLDSFKMGDRCRLLPLCNHSFHAQCVDSWLLKAPICPICRTRTDTPRKGEESCHFGDSTGNELRDGQTENADHGVGNIDASDNPGAVAGNPLMSSASTHSELPPA